MNLRFHFLPVQLAHPVRVTLEWVARALSSYAVPLVLALVSLVAIVAWDSPYREEPAVALAFRALPPDEAVSTTPTEAWRRLAGQSFVTRADTNLSEAPIWYVLRVPAALAGHRQAVEFPSRHAMDMACWQAPAMQAVGDALRDRGDGLLQPRKTGFVLELPTAEAAEFVCRSRFVGPARISAQLWDADALDASVRRFDRNLGLLDGGLTLLSLFLLLTALVNRRLLYVTFAAWLFLSMRIGGLSLGLDLMWLGHAVPPSLLALSRALTIAFYAVTLLTIYRDLFREDLAGTRYNDWMRWLHALSLGLVACALVLPHRFFLPVMWLVCATILVVMCASLVDIVRRTRSRVALWYSGALAVAALANLVEIAAAATGRRELVGVINSVTAALASSLLASLALAEQMRQEHVQRVQAQAELQHTFEAVPIGLFTLDHLGSFSSANPALQRMLGGPVTGARASWTQHFEDTSWPEIEQLAALRDEAAELEIRARAPIDGSPPRRFLVKATQTRGKIEGSLQDVTDKSHATEHLQFLADHDPLTKILNRRGILKSLRAALDRIDADGTPVALAYLDLDRFKLLNDLFGHGAGDEVLQQVCERISQRLSGAMEVGRMGGDEFIIVMPDTSVAHATLVCRNVLNLVGTETYRVGEKAFQVRVSIGLIEGRADHQVRDALMTADQACREAKRGGRGNGLVVYEKDANAFREHAAELELIEQLALPSMTERLFVEMQPIMSLHAPQSVLNFEVLLRMRDVDGALVPTPRLIHAAESSGHIGTIDRWVLSSTLAWLDAHRAQLVHTQFVCMNLSGASLNDERFMDDVFVMLAQRPDAARLLCFEITEGVALQDLENTRAFIDRVRSFGAKVALDDFGAGYTSFAYLRELPADVLKIDGNFVVNMNRHPANVAIVEAIVTLAHNLGMKTIAEWAEDTDTVRTLLEIGVDYVQGFVVARSKSPDDILHAPSSAAFIQDVSLLRLVQDLQAMHVSARCAEDIGHPPSPHVH